MTVRPRERQRVRQFALALEGGIVDEASTISLAQLADSLAGAGAAVGAVPSDTFKLALRNRILAVGAVTPTNGLVSPAPWRRRVVAASAVLAIATGSGAGLAVASADALPGSRLYDVKLAIENVRLALAPNDIAKAERYLVIASTRLSEIHELLAQNPNAAADPVLLEELRDTMAAMADAVSAGSELFFEVYQRTGDATILVPLQEFLAERSESLSSVRDLMPAELLGNQASLLVEMEGLAARVANLTGVIRSGDVGFAPVLHQRAARNAARNVLASSATALEQAIEAMKAAAAAAQHQAAEAAAAQQQDQATVEKDGYTPDRISRDVSKYFEVSVVGQDGAFDHVAVSTMPNSENARDFSTGSLRGSPATTAGSASSHLIWSLPLPSNDVTASVPGTLSASLSPQGARTAHLSAE